MLYGVSINGVKGVTRCLCYTHLRRAFVDALPKDIHGPEASKPSEAVLRLNKLVGYSFPQVSC